MFEQMYVHNDIFKSIAHVIGKYMIFHFTALRWHMWLRTYPIMWCWIWCKPVGKGKKTGMTPT